MSRVVIWVRLQLFADRISNQPIVFLPERLESLQFVVIIGKCLYHTSISQKNSKSQALFHVPKIVTYVVFVYPASGSNQFRSKHPIRSIFVKQGCLYNQSLRAIEFASCALSQRRSIKTNVETRERDNVSVLRKQMLKYKVLTIQSRK